MKFRLAVECQLGERINTSHKTLHAADLLTLKGSTATFACACPGCRDLHIVTRRAPVGAMRTNTTADPRMLLPITDTRYRIAMPYSLPLHTYYNRSFEFGGVVFRVVRLRGGALSLKPNKPLPASWLIDISSELPVDTEEEESKQLVV